MKNLKYLFSLFLVLFLIGCANDDNGIDNVDNVAAPSEMSALFTITQDNTGTVSIYPNSKNATTYDVFFGDGTVEPETITPVDAFVKHKYAEGVYTVKIIGYGINGLSTEYTQTLTVTFVPPVDVEILVETAATNPYQKNITAKALYETYFEVYFGEDPNQVPVQFNEGQTVSHTYAATGTYTVKVIAYSGGIAVTEETTEVQVLDPIVLPVTFESAASYNLGFFGGAAAAVVNNPSASGINNSAKVAKITKAAGAEVWAGISVPLDVPIDFSTMTTLSIKVYSPTVGSVIKLKLENLADANINVEVDATTTVANQWETLTYSFAGINNANNYQRVVVFYDFGNNGTGASFYFDDIVQSSGLPQVALPLTFENSALTYSFTGFGGSDALVITNPDATGINTSANVGKMVKNSGAQTYAGAFIVLGQPIDFSSMQKIKMKVWSPQAGITVKLKLENTPATPIEKDALTTVTNQWEELTFDFTGVVNANNYNTITIFFEFGAVGSGTTYYFDDIKLSN